MLEGIVPTWRRVTQTEGLDGNIAQPAFFPYIPHDLRSLQQMVAIIKDGFFKFVEFFEILCYRVGGPVYPV